MFPSVPDLPVPALEMLLGSHRRAVRLYEEVPAIFKCSAVCPLLLTEAEGPVVFFMAGRKQAHHTPAQLQFWHSPGQALSESELTLCQNLFEDFKCDAMFSAAALGEVLLLR